MWSSDGNYIFSLACKSLYGMVGVPSHTVYGVDNPFRSHIRMYSHYIDDLIFIAGIRLGAPEHFLEHLNNDKNLDFTGQCDRSKISFLDVQLYGDYSYQPLQKTLSGNTLLMAGAGHPGHTIKGTSFSQFLKVSRICSDQSTYKKEAWALYSHFYTKRVSQVDARQGSLYRKHHKQRGSFKRQQCL